MFRKHYDKKLFEKFNSLPVVKTFSQELINDGDFNSHNTEIKLPELSEGYYLVLYSLTDDFKYNDNINAYATCVVSNIASLERRNVDGSYDIYTMHRQTGDVLPNVTAQIWFDNYDYNEREQKLTKGETLKTDAKGFLHLKNDLIVNRMSNTLIESLAEFGFDANTFTADGVPDVALGLIATHYGIYKKDARLQTVRVAKYFSTIGARVAVQLWCGWEAEAKPTSNGAAEELLKQYAKNLTKSAKTTKLSPKSTTKN